MRRKRRRLRQRTENDSTSLARRSDFEIPTTAVEELSRHGLRGCFWSKSRRIAPIIFLLFFWFDQTSSAQRAKPKNKTRVDVFDLAQSQVAATLTQEGFIACRYATRRIEIRNFSGRIEVSEKAETQVEAEGKDQLRNCGEVVIVED